MANKSEAQLLNETLFEQLSTPGMEKTAIDAVNDFTRTKMREDGFYRRILPPLQISNDELDRQVDTDKPVKIVDKEPDSPAAISIPFATLPINLYIRGPRYRVMFDRIVTPRFTKDVDELRTYVMDIRQVLSDNAIKDMLAEEDSKFLAAVNTAIGTVGSTTPTSGTIQHKNIVGGISAFGVQWTTEFQARKIQAILQGQDVISIAQMQANKEPSNWRSNKVALSRRLRRR